VAEDRKHNHLIKKAGQVLEYFSVTDMRRVCRQSKQTNASAAHGGGDKKVKEGEIKRGNPRKSTQSMVPERAPF